MTAYFTALLGVFTIISMFLTFLFTSSLATSTSTLFALGGLGLCFDLLKCSLPTVTIGFFETRRFFYGAVCSLVCTMLVSFSLYSSYSLLENATADKAKGALEYQLTLQQLQQAQAEQQRLISINQLKVSREQLTPRIEQLSNRLAELSAVGNSTSSKLALIMNLILAALLELSVFACHIAMRYSSKKSIKKSAEYYTIDSVSTQHSSALPSVSLSANHDASNAIKSLTNAEIARILLERKESALSYRKISTKYGLSQGRIQEIKALMQQLQDSSQGNVIQLHN